jgi:hypothetical protein
MLGNWTGSAKGYIERAGYRDFSVANLTMSVTEQHDRFFSGTMTFPLANGSTRSEAFAGVIWTGGKSFRIVEYASGHDDGIILSENEIEMVYMDDNDPSFIMLDTLKRAP